jgi:hypothetical protein
VFSAHVSKSLAAQLDPPQTRDLLVQRDREMAMPDGVVLLGMALPAPQEPGGGTDAH